MRPRHALAIALLTGAGSAAAQDLNRITAVEVRDEGRTVSLSVTGSKPPNFTTFSMADPPRFVLDLSEAKFVGVPEDIPVNDGTILVVKNLSYGSEATSIARIMIAFSVDVDPPDVQAQGNALLVRVAKPAGAAVAKAGPSAAELEAQRAREQQEAQRRAEAEAAAKAEAKARAEAEAQARAEAEVKAEAERAAARQAEADAARQAAAPPVPAAPAGAGASPGDTAALLVGAQTGAEKKPAEDEDSVARAERERESQAAAAAGGEDKAQSDAERQREERIAAAKAEKERKREEALEKKAAAQREREERIAAAKAEKERKREEAAAKRAEAKRQREEAVAAARAEAEARRTAAAEAKAEAKRQREEALAAAPSAAQLRELGFKQMPGVSRVFVRTSAPPRFTIQDVGENLIRVELENTRVVRRNDVRFLDTSFFPTAVALITPSRRGTSYVVDIKLKQKVPYQQKLEGDMLAIDFERPTAAAEPPAPGLEPAVATEAPDEQPATAPDVEAPAAAPEPAVEPAPEKPR